MSGSCSAKIGRPPEKVARPRLPSGRHPEKVARPHILSAVTPAAGEAGEPGPIGCQSGCGDTETSPSVVPHAASPCVLPDGGEAGDPGSASRGPCRSAQTKEATALPPRSRVALALAREDAKERVERQKHPPETQMAAEPIGPPPSHTAPPHVLPRTVLSFVLPDDGEAGDPGSESRGRWQQRSGKTGGKRPASPVPGRACACPGRHKGRLKRQNTR